MESYGSVLQSSTHEKLTDCRRGLSWSWKSKPWEISLFLPMPGSDSSFHLTPTPEQLITSSVWSPMPGCHTYPLSSLVTNIQCKSLLRSSTCPLLFLYQNCARLLPDPTANYSHLSLNFILYLMGPFLWW